MRRRVWIFTLGLAALVAASTAAQQKGGVDLHGSYDAVAGWMKPYTGE